MTPSEHLARRSIVLSLLSQEEAEKRAVEIAPTIARMLGCTSSALSILQATEKSQTYAFTASGERLVAKVHSDSRAMCRERLGLLLFRGGPLPSLVAALDDPCLLVMTWSAGRPFEANRDSLPLVVSSLARLHITAQRNLGEMGTSIRQRYQIGAARAWDDTNAFPGLRRACSTLWGEDHVPVAISDLKPEHVLVDSGRCTFVDFETTSVGCSELHDLLSLVDFVVDPSIFWSQWEDELAEQYLRAAQLAPGATSAGLTEAMRLYAEACTITVAARPR